MTLFPHPRGNPPYSARGTFRRGLNSPAGLFFTVHRVAHVRQNPRHDVSKPLHVCPSVATSKSQTEKPRCRSNQPSLEIPAKVQMI